MNGKQLRIWRYISFVLVGIAVEAVSLLAFRGLSVILRPEVAYILSFPVNVIAGFALFGWITFRDRPGSLWGKLARFTVGKLAVLLVKALMFPLWLRLVPCPLYALTHAVVDVLGFTGLLHGLFTCDWMSVALMDLATALTLGYFVSNKFAFWKHQ